MEGTSEEKTTIDPWSLVPFPVRPHAASMPLAGVATAFLATVAGQLYLVSNWHVLSGRNAATRQPIHASAAICERVVADVPLRTKEGGVEWIEMVVGLCDGKGEALWYEHPEHGSLVDVGMLPWEVSGAAMTADKATLWTRHVNVAVGQDVFVLGYPFGFRAGHILPIWKRATIASEPELDLDDLPKLLVDTATRAGMSGAPVVMRQPMIQMPAAGFTITSGGRAGALLGVYSGRIGAESALDAQLGLVWKARVLDEIAAGRKPAALTL